MYRVIPEETSKLYDYRAIVQTQYATIVAAIDGARELAGKHQGKTFIVMEPVRSVRVINTVIDTAVGEK